MAIERLRENNQGVGSKKFKKHQFIEAFTDPQTYYITLFVIISAIVSFTTTSAPERFYINWLLTKLKPNGFLTTFKNIILKGFGLTPEKSLLYGAPNGAGKNPNNISKSEP